MRKFKDLTEAKETAVFGFGRFNPSTIGHEAVIEKIASVAKSNPFFIYPSHTTGPKDPLKHSLKIAWMRKMFPKYKRNIIVDNNAKTAIQIAEKLYKDGYKNLIMVAGSDRVNEFDTLLQRYNDAPDKKGNQLFKFDSIKVVSAGERDPDADGVAGMSASKLRKAASEGKFDEFKKGIPDTLNDADKKKYYFAVRKGMGIRENREMGKDFDSLRDAYLTGKIWNVGEVVEANGVSGEVVRKGTNYLSFVADDGKVHKAWLHDIVGVKPMSGPTGQIFALKSEEVELDERNYAKEYANYQGTPEQIARRSSRNKARRAMGDKAVKGKDVGHKDNDPLNNDPKNLRNEDPSKNRREPRLREANAPDIKKGDTIILNKAKRPYTMAGITDPKKTLPAESDKMVVNKITKTSKGRKAHLTYHDTKKRGGFAIYLDKMPDFMSVKIVEEVELDEAWYNDVAAKMSQIRHPKGWETMAKMYAAGMKDQEHRKHPSAWAAEVSNKFRGVEGRQLVKYINKLVDAGKLPKELKAELQVESFKDFIEQINEGAYGYEKQDPDIKGKDGTQPAKYHKGLSKDTKKKRDAHFKAKKTGPAPGDADAETKPSVHTKKFKDMFGEDATKGLKNKADKSGVSYSILKKVYDRGLAAYKTGHRPGTTAPQWAMARVNSFLTGGGARKADNDLWKSTKKEDTDIWNLQDACWQGYKQVGMKKKGSKEVPNCVPEELGPNATQRDYIDDFIDSDAPQFKGKDKKKRVAMAIAAFRSKNEEWEGLNEWGEVEEESEYQGRKVTLNKPTSGDVKKSKVYVKNEKGTVVKVNFGDPNMTIKKNIPARRKSFRARHNCDNPGPKWKARYWSCKAW